MRDPLEGLDARGCIRTGVGRAALPAAFVPIVHALVDEFDAVRSPDAELHLYGSVATGQARAGTSDVDVLAIGVPDAWAHDIGRLLSDRFRELTRAVEIGVAGPDDFLADTDEGYGNRVFLRHYCRHLAGATRLRPRHDFAGDARAARGFNGDIAIALDRWRADPPPEQRAARKSLVAAAGIVSVRTGTWSTDRAAAARAWARLDPAHADDVAELAEWADGTSTATPSGLDAALAEGGVIGAIAERFATEIGLWGF